MRKVHVKLKGLQYKMLFRYTLQFMAKVNIDFNGIQIDDVFELNGKMLRVKSGCILYE